MNTQYHPAPRLKYKLVGGNVVEYVKVTVGEGRRAKCIGWRPSTGPFKDTRAHEVDQEPDPVLKAHLWLSLLAEPTNLDVLAQARWSYAKAKATIEAAA